jgi:hypothetical protein
VTAPGVAEAVKTPVEALIVPVPLRTEKVYGDDPPAAENVVELFTANSMDVGEIPRLENILTVADEVFPTASVAVTTADPGDVGAVYKPVLPFTVPVPLVTENEIGATPPVVVNV